VAAIEAIVNGLARSGVLALEYDQNAMTAKEKYSVERHTWREQHGI
jgi:hypothetical protein